MTRSPVSNVLSPENDPIVPHIQVAEDLGRRALMEAGCYREAIDDEVERGIVASPAVFEHRVDHQTMVALALLEAAVTWFLDPMEHENTVARIAAEVKDLPATEQVKALTAMLNDQVEAENQMQRELADAEAARRRNGLYAVEPPPSSNGR